MEHGAFVAARAERGELRVVDRERLLEGAGRVRDIARNSKGEVFVAIEGAGTVVHLKPMVMK